MSQQGDSGPRRPDLPSRRASDSSRSIPEATVGRLAVYLRVLVGMGDDDVITVSSEELATAAGVNSAMLRKDLSHLGSYGTRGVGYEVTTLISHISRTLGLTEELPVAVVGVGNLGRALAGYAGFSARGIRVAALFDADPAQVGQRIGQLTIRHTDDVAFVVAQHAITIAVIATPAHAAQDACDRLVAAGVTSVLNFAPIVLAVPPHVDVRKVDLAAELQILSFHEHRKTAVPPPRGAPAGVRIPAERGSP
ncbi:MAG: redox-sensing transcriptional repressor Rex [Frankiaceae bacterium]|jgi:redox-sensing transcriptional repressor|nr:redox-sensing transcriptional repressor Rex [Frankiaceae bacterium]